MPSLDIISKTTFKEVITSVELIDLNGNGKSNVIVTTLNGDVRVYDFNKDEKKPLTEICRLGDLPPLAAIGVGDVTGDGIPDFVMGGLDNTMRVLVYLDETISVKASTPLGSLPTAVAVLNVLDDESAEVIVSTNDGSMRCYGWYDVALDKLAHKVLDRPVFSIWPLRTKGMPYSRFVFGDDTGYFFIYQYADDRLHERNRVSVGGEVGLISTGDVTEDHNSEVMTLSDNRTLTLYGLVKGSMEKIDSIRAPNTVCAIRMGRFWDLEPARGQILVSHANSSLAMLSVVGRQLSEEAVIKTAKKSTESSISVGDVDGDSRDEIVQAVGNNLYIIDFKDDYLV
ncbi:VCBS repeat-containing protein [Candidatus Thorarchaeota archaeon]|nr:MAG: VCBS repeat-containing protein [Candidatus Thorarchaeota archaeon]